MDKSLFKEKFALGLTVAILSFLISLATQKEVLNYQIFFYMPNFVVFFAWASYYLAGAGMQGSKTALTMNGFGAVLAYLAVQLGVHVFAPAGAGVLSVPIGVFIVCFPLCLAGMWNKFAITPLGFVGAASVFAVGYTQQIGPSGYHQVLLSTFIALFIGSFIIGPICNKMIAFFVAVQGGEQKAQAKQAA